MAMQKGQLPCDQCGGLVEVELQDKPSIVNREHVSLLLVDHSGVITCPHCLLQMIPVMVSVGAVAIRLARKTEEGVIIQ